MPWQQYFHVCGDLLKHANCSVPDVTDYCYSKGTKGVLRFGGLFAFIPLKGERQAKNPTPESDNKSCLLLTNCSSSLDGFLAASQLVMNF